MIQLRFTVTDGSLETASSPELTPWGAIVETVFEMPIFFTVNGINLLGFPDGQTMHLSVVGFALGAVEVITRLSPGGCERMHIGSAGSLFMQEANGRVRFWTTTLRPDAEVPYEEAVAAFHAFAREVQRVMETRVPDIRKHPHWSRWFPPADSAPRDFVRY